MADAPLVVRVAANLEQFRANLLEGINQIESTSTAMRQMATAYDGSRTISQAGAVMAAIQAVGGVTHLTADEQARANAVLDQAIQKYAALGKEAPPGMQALADATKKVAPAAADATTQVGMFENILARVTERVIAFAAVREIFSFGKEILESTARLEDLSLATGITAENIQRLAYVGTAFGIDIEQMARGVEQLSAKLATGDANATLAVQKLGLSVSALIAAGPEEAFVSIAEAVGHIEDPMLKSGMATELFGGKLAKTLLPALGELREKIDQVPKGAIISDANVESAKNFETFISHAKTGLEAWIVQTNMLPVQIWNAFWKKAPTDIELVAGAIPKVVTAAQLWKNELDALSAKQHALTEVNVGAIAADAALGASVKDLATHYGLTEAAVISLIDGHKKFAAAMVDLNAAGTGWKGTLDTIDGSVVEAIRYYLDAGVSQNKLAEAYGLTEVQVKAVASAVRDETEAMKLQGQTAAENTKLWDDYTANLIKANGTATDVELANLKKVSDDMTAKRILEGTADADYYALRTSLDRQATDAILTDHARVAQGSIEALQQEYEKQQATLEGMLTGELHYSRTAIDAQIALRDATLDALHQIPPAAAPVVSSFDAWNTSIMGVNQSLSRTVSTMQMISMAQAAMSSNPDSQVKSVATLGGEMITPAEAKKRFDSGGTSEIPTLTITDANKASFVARLKQIEQEYATFPGRQSGVNGPTGLNPMDSAGWSIMLNEQIEFASLKKALPGYAGGVLNAPGGFAMVGERGPEAMYVPPGANIYPHGSAAGTSITIAPGAIVLNYPVMNNPRAKQEIADLVGDAIMTKWKAMGGRS